MGYMEYRITAKSGVDVEQAEKQLKSRITHISVYTAPAQKLDGRAS